jgi:predicted O-linked N-acetylglucosamine transferase (SPINDLY family)
MIDLGEFFRQDNQVEKAISILEEATKLAPQNANAWTNLGTALQQDGEIVGAKLAYQKALAINPKSAAISNNLGAFAKEAGDWESALHYFKQVINIQPDLAEAHSNLGITLKELGRLEEAEESYKKAIAIKPDLADVHYNLGNTLRELGRLEEAEESYKKAIDIKPNLAETHSNFGITLQELGRLEEAEASYKRAIAINADLAEVHNNLGNTLKELGRLEEAEESYKKAISIKPGYAEAHNNLGITLRELGRRDEALASYQKAILLKPDYAQGYNNLGITLNELGLFDEAIDSYRKALALKPNLAEAHINMGNTLQALGKLKDAEISDRKALALKPDYSEAHSNLGFTLKLQHRYVDAQISIRRALFLDPKSAFALQNYSLLLAHTSNYKEVCKFSDDALKYALLNSKKERIASVWESRLYTWLYHPDLSAQEICNEHIKWGNRYSDLGQEEFPTHNRIADRKLRIGYVSPDFRAHNCIFYFEPLFASHDKTRFELFAYSNVIIQDELTERMKTYFDGWRDVFGVSDEAVAKMIQDDKIDILVHGCGHMRYTRLTVFAHKPAPIQVTWLGSAWTTGLPQMDYVLFDPYMAPKGIVASEKIVRLPRTWAAFRPGEKAMNAVVKTTPAATNGYVTFGYTGRTERLNHRVFHAWGKILKRLPHAQLVLDYNVFADPNTQDYYKKFLHQHGLDTTRITMRYSENIF